MNCESEKWQLVFWITTFDDEATITAKRACSLRPGLAAGWAFRAVSAPMTMHIKERNFLFKTKSQL
jgi:hypothetical protein